MSVVPAPAIPLMDPQDTFDSFIDEDAVGDSSSTPSDDATTALTSSIDGFTSHHTSVPTTPKMASEMSFGPSLNPDGSSSLHDFSIDWDDMSASHHNQSHHGHSARATSMSLDNAWPPAPSIRRSLDDAPSADDYSAFDHGGYMHHRSMSLSMHDVAPQFLNDLKAQAPTMPAREPFIKMEPDVQMTPFGGVGDMIHSAFPAMAEGHFHAVHAPSVAMPLTGATQETTAPQEKKRKVEAPKQASQSKPKKSAPKKKTPSVSISTQQQPGAEAAAEQQVGLPTSSAVPTSQTADEPTEIASPNEVNAVKHSDKGAEKEPGAPSQQTSVTATGGMATNGPPCETMETPIKVEPDQPADSRDTQSDNGAGGRKPAAKSKKPPPSASQITESGKPFPVIDTSAAHSSLFVPPDTSGLTKREARLVKNRAAAFLSRQRKREQFELLEKQCKSICRLTWKMWETIAGPEADVSRLNGTVLPALLAEEHPDVRDCLEQIVVNKGASIAPTEESIANGTHGLADDQSKSSATPSSCEHNGRASPAPSAKSAGSKRDREEEPAANGTPDSHAVIKQLREQLQAADRREAALIAALAQQKAQSDSSSAPSNVTAPHVGETASSGVSNVNANGQLFREGPSGDSGLSLTEAIQLAAEDADMAAVSSTGHSQPSGIDEPKPAKSDQTGAVSAATVRRSATSSMALMVLLFGFALFGSGGMHAASDMPRMGITRLGPLSGAHASLGSLMDPLLSSGRSHPISGLIRRGEDQKEEADEDHTGEGRNPPSSHLSANDLALDTEQQLSNIATRMMQDVTDLLPQCSLDDSDCSMDAESTESAPRRPPLRRWQSDTSATLQAKLGAGAAAALRSSAASAHERVQQGLIFFGGQEGLKTDAEMKAETSSQAWPSSDQAPRKLKLFLRRRALSNVGEGTGASKEKQGARLAPASAASSEDQDDVFVDAGTMTPTSSHDDAVAAAAPSSRIGAATAPNSFMELEFSLSRKRMVKDESELAQLIQQAAQRASLGGGATFSS